MKAKDLKHGDLFKIGAQRNFRTFNKGFILGENALAEDIGKMLVIYDGCSQLVIDPNTEISEHKPHEKFVPKSPTKRQLTEALIFLFEKIEAKSILITPVDLQKSMFIFQNTANVPNELIRVWFQNELGISPEETTHYHRLLFENSTVSIDKEISRGRPYLIKRELINNYSVE